jgi:hypothetical protein
VPTNKQRREAERRHLERQLQNRRVREARRRKQTLIISIAMTIVLIAGIVVTIVVLSSGSTPKKKNNAAKKTPTPVSTSPAASACPTAGSAPQKVAKGTGKLVSFNGVTVRGATDLSKPPTVGSTATKPPTKLVVKDLVVGKGKVVKPTDSVQVKYDGVFYCDGTEFDGPAEHGDKVVPFSLQKVVPGFTEGIGGTKGIAPMRIGGRRIIIMPSALAYGPQPNGNIPANSPLVFVVDLKGIQSSSASSSPAVTSPASPTATSTG